MRAPCLETRHPDSHGGREAPQPPAPSSSAARLVGSRDPGGGWHRSGWGHPPRGKVGAQGWAKCSVLTLPFSGAGNLLPGVGVGQVPSLQVSTETPLGRQWRTTSSQSFCAQKAGRGKEMVSMTIVVSSLHLGTLRHGAVGFARGWQRGLRESPGPLHCPPAAAPQSSEQHSGCPAYQGHTGTGTPQ